MNPLEKLESRAKGKEEDASAKEVEAERIALLKIEECASLMFINDKIKAGQSKTGLMSLVDCENHISAVEVTFNTFSKLRQNEEGDKNPSKVHGDDLRSWAFIKAVVDGMQSKGVYEIEESAEIIKHIRLIDAIFSDNFDEELTKARMESQLQGKKKDLKDARTKKNKKKK
tara:strand:+ start:148957 stop:149469 length:513 start_codon:yes stop_codon:yes gene_type:complete